MRKALQYLFIVLISFQVHAESPGFYTLGTGGVTGVYYPTGGAICRLVNLSRTDHGIRCAVVSTGGTLANLRQIRAGKLELAIVQSDWLYHAYRGTDQFNDRPAVKGLRTLFTLYPEYFTVVARTDAGISSFEQIKGRKVSVGKPGSGQRATLQALITNLGWSFDDFDAMELDPAEQAEALCKGDIDVMIYPVGHPSGATKEVTRDCDSRLIPVTGDFVLKAKKDNPQYQALSIPGGLYQGNPEDVETIGMMATFVTDESLSNDAAYHIVRSVFTQFEQFRRMHPAFLGLKPQDMVRGPFTAPLHPGALRYYKESGLLVAD